MSWRLQSIFQKSQLEQEFYERKYLKELLIIKKNDELITFSRR